MVSHSKLPGAINRGKLLRALKRLGFSISMSGGNGSHCKITWPANGKSVTIKQKIIKQTLGYLLPEIEKISKITWDQISAVF